MDAAQDQIGCRPLLLWTSVVLLAFGILPFVPLEGTGYAPFLAGWAAIVLGSLIAGSSGLSAAIDRFAPSGSGGARGALTVVGTLLVAAAGVWSGWMLLGPPAVGTMAEAVPLIVDPLVGGAVAIAFSPRSERLPAAVYLAAAVVVAAVMLRFVAAVGPTYSG